MTTAHVVGAGLAGLSAAVTLTSLGRRVVLYEAAPRGGGRCRSYFDPHLGCAVDNGGHVILGANREAFAYLETIGSRGELDEIAPATFSFVDLETRETWQVRPNAGPLPWWVLAPSRRTPGTRLSDYLQLAKLSLAGADETVAERLDTSGLLFKRFVCPLATAVLNTAAEEAAVRPFVSVLRDTLYRGERACRAAIARRGLTQAFVDPALAWLERRGGIFHAQTRLEQMRFGENRVTALEFGKRTVDLAASDCIVLAVPPWAAGILIPGLLHPRDHRAIVNAHFRLPGPVRFPGGKPLLGLIGGTAQWLIARDDVLSVTVSAADALIERPAHEVLGALWRDTAVALDIGSDRPMPPARLVKERRATFAQTPAAQRLRPGARTRWTNLFLAGDWTATGLPATIEGAIRSGRSAAELAHAAMRSENGPAARPG